MSDVVELLIEFGANVDLTNMANETALMKACLAGRRNSVRALLMARPQLELQDKVRTTRFELS